MSGKNVELIKWKEDVNKTRSDLSALEKTINPLHKLAKVENDAQKSQQEQQKINDIIVEKSREINTLYTMIKDNNNTINEEYENTKKILDANTRNEINNINQKLEHEARIILKEKIDSQEWVFQKTIQDEDQRFNQDKLIREKKVNEEINNTQKKLNECNTQIEEKEKTLKMIAESKDYKKWIKKQKKWKKLNEKEQLMIDEWNTIQTDLHELQSKKDVYSTDIESIKENAQNSEKEVWEKHTKNVNTFSENHTKTITQLITDQKEQIRIASWLPSNEELIIKRESEDKQLQQEVKQKIQKTNEQYYKRINQLESEIQSTKIDLKIKSLELEQIENEKQQLMSEISWVAQPKIEFMNTTIVENSWLLQLLGDTKVNSSKDQWILDKNRDEITEKANEISEQIRNEMEPEDKKAIEDAILNHLKHDQSYKNKINEIILQWTQSWKSMEEIKWLIQVYNQAMIKKLFPVFLIEIEEWKIIVNRANWSPVILWNKSKELLAKNQSYQAFKKLYQQFIENPLLDLTDLNYLSREWITENTASGLEKQLIDAVSTNRDIENFLFNNPQANPDEIQNTLGNLFEKPLNKKQQRKIAKLMWKKIPENKQEKWIKDKNKKNLTQKKSLLPLGRKEEFLNEINTFTTKRINQSLLLWHCDTLRETFWLITSQWTKLVDAIAFDFNTLSITESWNQIKQNITYQNLASTITIDGSSWTVTMPNTLSSLRWTQKSSPLTKLPISLQERKKIITKAATLMEKELLTCNNWSDVQSRITEKIRHASEKMQSTLWSKTVDIAENLEKESFIMNFTNFMAGSVNIKNTEQINKNALSKNENNQHIMQLLLQKRTQWKEWTLPMNLHELKQLNTIFMDKKLQKLVDNKEGIPSDNWDTFFDTIWFYTRWPNASFEEIMTFFKSLKDMAYSQVDHEHENGYIALQALLNKKWYSWSLQYKSDHTVLI